MKKLIILNLLFSLSLYAAVEKKQEISKVKFVKPKTTMKEVEVTRTSFHGKKLKRKYDTTINHKANTVALDKYLEAVRIHLNELLPTVKSSKYKPFMVKIQIQKSGGLDILFVNSADQKVQDYVYSSFEALGEILPIPKETGQSEIQVELYFI